MFYPPKEKPISCQCMPESLQTGSAAMRAFHTAMAKAVMMGPGVRIGEMTSAQKGMTFPGTNLCIATVPGFEIKSLSTKC